MNNIKILESGSYFPKRKVNNEELENQLELQQGYIYKRTGIKERYYSKEETIDEIAIKAVENLFSKQEGLNYNIGLIIVATTTTNYLMPGIANKIQKELGINKCICLDILSGCAGFINAFDIAKLYLNTNKIERALVIGVENLSKYIDKKDISTSIILSDGAGAILLEKNKNNKKYFSNIEAIGKNNEILTCKSNENIYMNGKEIYKYAVTETVKNIKELLKESNEKLENVKYIVPHQSNMKIIKGIASRLEIGLDKIYTNIEYTGNTFCASIPIALNDMKKQELLKSGDKIILLGYGGGLNTGSILLEI